MLIPVVNNRKDNKGNALKNCFHVWLGKKKSITFSVDGCCTISREVSTKQFQIYVGCQANYVQFWFRRFRSGIFDVKDALHTGSPAVENVDTITEIIEVNRHVSSRSIAREVKIDYKTVLNHLCKVGFKKKLDVWVPHQLTPTNMMDRISTCKVLYKWNEIDPFLKRMMTGDEKWVTYDNIM
ncbi:histone-lysine N-methyltransferase SETMAR [Trichonephila clavipes]|nr:histone-lysine N-methyltransferase SETMAR [Trichonephila clavipes]